MAVVVENDVLIKYKDENNTVNVLYPVTKWANVEGSADRDTSIQAVNDNLSAHLNDTNDPHNSEDLDAIRNFGYTATSTDGVTYRVTTDRQKTGTKTGSMLVIIPTMTSTTTTPVLNVNDEGDRRICRRYSDNTTSVADGINDGWLVQGKPVIVLFDGTRWIADLPKPNAEDLAGVVPVNSGGTGSADGSIGLNNLLKAGPMILSSDQYGTSLPNAGTVGRLFFKKV